MNVKKKKKKQAKQLLASNKPFYTILLNMLLSAFDSADQGIFQFRWALGYQPLPLLCGHSHTVIASVISPHCILSAVLTSLSDRPPALEHC